MTARIWAIPGFMGLPEDWNHLEIENLSGAGLNDFSWSSLEEWGKKFNQSINPKEKNVILGYSLGGRLALHALIDNPTLWAGAIIISAHPGLVDPQEKLKRHAKDKEWAKRFAEEEWDDLMSAWNQQPVFQQDPFHFNRQEKDYSRQFLSQTMLNGSLGLQNNLRPAIEKLPLPILWITGEKDQTYSNLAANITFSHLRSCHKIIPDAGHRLPWSQPHLLKSGVQNFLN